MDGISDESPLLPVILLWDHVDYFLQHRPLFVLISCLILSYASIIGRFLDLGLFALFVVRHESYKTGNAWVKANKNRLLIALCVCSTVWGLIRSRTGRPVKNEGRYTGPSQPYLIPCRTTHSRIVPKKHSFSYSYLLVGIPIGFKGNVNGMISSDLSFSKAWYDVAPADYLERDSTHLGLRGKLDNYLKSQGAKPSEYPYAYLVTAARFLGYHFNPVSFWYLYSENKTLVAVVLEVNNTFGERRPYLVERDFEAEAKQLQDAEASEKPPRALRARVKNSWKKDFHVSPFNSRKGSYSLTTRDPLGENLEGFRGVDITINLTSSKGQGKLVARLFSEGEAIDPAQLNVFGKALFLIRWFWVGFVTFPRIVKEAALLFFKRNLHVWYRPEPLRESNSRYATVTEGQLALVFREYLRYLVEQSPEAIDLTYVPSGVRDAGKEVFKSVKEGPGREHLEFKVLTPAFYARFAGYAHDFEAIFCEMAESCTVWCDKPHLLPKIFLKKPSPSLTAPNLIDFVTFKLIQRLRRRPEAIRRPLTSAEATPQSTPARDIRDFRMSSMDAFVLRHGDSNLKDAYRSAISKVFVAERWLGGFAELIDIAMITLRVGTLWAMASWACS